MSVRSRREILQCISFALTGLASRCAMDPSENMSEQPPSTGRLSSRSDAPRVTKAEPGVHALGIGGRRDGVVLVPAGYDGGPAPLALMLHGAGGNAHNALRVLRGQHERLNMLLLAVDSRRDTWDLMYGGLGDDVSFIDEALELTFERYNVDRKHVAIGGFSDGASYALTLGIANGDLFTHIIAFSPGFMNPPSHAGQPLIYVSHGTEDQILPIERCSRRLVPMLKKAGYRVEYNEFEGPHTVPETIARGALQWFLT